MSFEFSLLVSLCRAILIVLIGLALIGPIRRVLSKATAATMTWWALLLPAMFPGLVVGYAFANSSLSLIHHPELNESLYTVLLAIRAIPFGIVAYLLTPSGPISQEALHCWGLANDRKGATTTWLRGAFTLGRCGPMRGYFIAGTTIFLVCFQDFELASMLGTTAWPVWLFDAQAAGLDLDHSLWHASISCVPQVIILGFTAMTVASSGTTRVQNAHNSGARSKDYWVASIYCVVAASLGAILPIAFVLRGTIQGVVSMLQNVTLFKEIAIAFGGGNRRRKRCFWTSRLCCCCMAHQKTEEEYCRC